jgi:hypothetical protein
LYAKRNVDRGNVAKHDVGGDAGPACLQAHFDRSYFAT